MANSNMMMAAVVLLALAAGNTVHAACYPTVSGATVSANTDVEQFFCQSTQSDCMHPDPSTELDPNSCNGGGEDPYYAGSNKIACNVTIVTASPKSQHNCTVNLSFNADLYMGMTVAACPGFIGTQRVSCTTTRASDDSTGNGPNSVIGTASNLYTYNAVACGVCIHGVCDDVVGCRCNAGYFGETCDDSGASATAVSFAAIALGLVGAAFSMF